MTRAQWQKRQLVKLAKECEAALTEAAALPPTTGQAQAMRNKAAFLSEVCFRLSAKLARGTW